MPSIPVRRRYLGLCALIVAGCTRSPRPDILLVTIDTLRADHSSAYGYAIQTTPTVEELAGQGVLFRTVYAPTATTGPSHASLLASHHPRSLGVLKNGQELTDDAVTLAEVLADAGYTTAAFVSSLPVRSRFGFAQGFSYFNENFRPQDVSIGRESNSAPHDRRAEATVHWFLRWIRKRPAEEHLFAWVHLVDPHAPYRPPDPFRGGWPKGTRGHIRRYDGEVHYADHWFGEVLRAMRAHPSRDGTLVVVTSDHGEGLGDHGWMTHGLNLYEEAVRVPLVASWPGRLAEGTKVDRMVSLIDVAPGILGLVGIKAPEVWDGTTLFADSTAERPVFLQRRSYKTKKVKGQVVRGDMFAVVTQGQKLVTAEEEDRTELYDLANDPREKRNVADALPEEVERRGALIQQWEQDFPPPAVEPKGPSAEDVRALRQLGYVD